MNGLSIKRESYDITIPNLFISEILCKAPTEKTIIFLQLVSHAGKSIEEISSQTGILTETLIKGITYWEERGVLIKNPTTEDFVVCFDIQPLLSSGYKVPKEISGYIGRELSVSELDTILFIRDNLGFTDELTLFLLKYCADREKFASGYIKTIALSWSEKGIKTIEEARANQRGNTRQIYKYLNMLGRRDNIAPIEISIVRKWIETYRFSEQAIVKAIEKAVINCPDKKLAYADKVLTVDFNKDKQSGTVKNKTHFALERDYDFEKIEKSIIESQQRALGQ